MTKTNTGTDAAERATKAGAVLLKQHVAYFTSRAPISSLGRQMGLAGFVQGIEQLHGLEVEVVSERTIVRHGEEALAVEYRLAAPVKAEPYRRYFRRVSEGWSMGGRRQPEPPPEARGKCVECEDKMQEYEDKLTRQYEKHADDLAKEAAFWEEKTRRAQNKSTP